MVTFLLHYYCSFTQIPPGAAKEHTAKAKFTVEVKVA